MTIRSHIHQNPLHDGQIRRSADEKAIEKHNPNRLEEFERMAASLSNKSFATRFTGNTSIPRSKSRSRALSRSRSRPRALFRTKSLSRASSRSRAKSRPITTAGPGPKKSSKKYLPRPITKKINPSILGNVNLDNDFAKRHEVPTFSPSVRSSALPRAIIKPGRRLHPHVKPRARKSQPSNILGSILTPGPENAR